MLKVTYLASGRVKTLTQAASHLPLSTRDANPAWGGGVHAGARAEGLGQAPARVEGSAGTGWEETRRKVPREPGHGRLQVCREDLGKQLVGGVK